MVTAADIRLEQTCDAFPEQYNAWLGPRRVGYLRLRHGLFYVQCPECSLLAWHVYAAEDVGQGEFADEATRARELLAAREAIAAWVNETPGWDANGAPV